MHRRQNQDISTLGKINFLNMISSLTFPIEKPFFLIQIGMCGLAKLVSVLLSVWAIRSPYLRTSRQTDLLEEAFNFLYYTFVNTHLQTSLQMEATYEGFLFLCQRRILVVWKLDLWKLDLAE